MSKLSKETKIELLELSKKITNSISFADVEDIDVSLSDYSDDQGARSRVNIDIMFKENER